MSFEIGVVGSLQFSSFFKYKEDSDQMLNKLIAAVAIFSLLFAYVCEMSVVSDVTYAHSHKPVKMLDLDFFADFVSDAD